MKLLFLLVAIGVVGIIVYIFTTKLFTSATKHKKSHWKSLGITAGVVVVLLGLLGFGLYLSATQPDMQCAQIHNTNPAPLLDNNAQGHFKLGDFYYDQGNCAKAITEYTKAIELDPAFYQAYNNMAYTYMRMRNYNAALSDLDKALAMDPNYIQALMNRGDIHNYYYHIDRQAAIADYRKVIALTDTKTRQQTSVCGHLFLAKHNGWTLGAYLGYFTGEWATCK